MFQHTAARRRLRPFCCPRFQWFCFNTQPPEGGCFGHAGKHGKKTMFQHTAARRRLQENE